MTYHPKRELATSTGTVLLGVAGITVGGPLAVAGAAAAVVGGVGVAMTVEKIRKLGSIRRVQRQLTSQLSLASDERVENSGG